MANTDAPPVTGRPAPMARLKTTVAMPKAMPSTKSTGSARPTIAPASARVGSTANAAGVMTAATKPAAPSHAARSVTLTSADACARWLIA